MLVVLPAWRLGAAGVLGTIIETASANDVVDGASGAVYAAAVIEAATATDSVTLPTNPSNILSALICWWDASVTASLSLTGSTINSVADQSGHGFTLVPESGTTNPTYSATGFNSLPSMMFNGTSKQALSAFISPMFGASNPNMTAFYAGTLSSSAPGDARAISFTASTDARDFNTLTSFLVGRYSTNNGIEYFRNSVLHSVAITMNVPHRIIVTTDSSGNRTIYLNGTASTVAGTGGNFGANGTVVIGSTQWDLDTAASWTGAIAEVGVAASYSDASTAAALDTYLKNKWGL